MPSVQSKDCTLHYEVIDLVAPWIARPETILFNHGLASNSDSWALWLPELIDRYRIVRFDLRGHGRSSVPTLDSELTFKTLCDDVIAVADAADLDRFHFVGESIGGTTGLALACDQAARLRTLTVSNAAFFGETVSSTERFQEFMEQHGMSGWSSHVMKGRFFEDSLTPEVWNWYQNQQAMVPADFFMRGVDLLVGVDLSADLPRITVPTLLLSGDSSPFVPLKTTTDMRNAMPNARLQIFSHAKHGLPVSHAKECGKALRYFLDAQQAS